MLVIYNMIDLCGYSRTCGINMIPILPFKQFKQYLQSDRHSDIQLNYGHNGPIVAVVDKVHTITASSVIHCIITYHCIVYKHAINLKTEDDDHIIQHYRNVFDKEKIHHFGIIAQVQFCLRRTCDMPPTNGSLGNVNLQHT